jgi:hypothetical protein
MSLPMSGFGGMVLPEAQRARLMLGLGVSHGPLIGEGYGRPLATHEPLFGWTGCGEDPGRETLPRRA